MEHECLQLREELDWTHIAKEHAIYAEEYQVGSNKAYAREHNGEPCAISSEVVNGRVLLWGFVRIHGFCHDELVIHPMIR